MEDSEFIVEKLDKIKQKKTTEQSKTTELI